MVKQKLWAVISRVAMLIVLVCGYASTKGQTIINTNTTWDPGNLPTLSGDYHIGGNAVLTIDAVNLSGAGAIYVRGNAKIMLINNASLTCGSMYIRTGQQNKIDGSTLICSQLYIDSNYTFLLVKTNSVVRANLIDINDFNELKVEDNSTIQMYNAGSNIHSWGRINVHGFVSTTTGPGGKLTVTDSKITSTNNSNTWGGISVEGGDASHYVKQTNGNPGLVVLNNAIIENSKYGVINWDRSQTTDYSGLTTTGGIIIAKNTSFLNNDTSIQLHHYQNLTTSNQPTDDQSIFLGCTFKTQFISGRSYENMIRLKEVNGIYILGCTFENENGLRGSAIHSDGSSVIVQPWCQVTTGLYCIGYGTSPCSSIMNPPTTNPPVPSTFKNVNVGITATSVNNISDKLVVRHVLFEDIDSCAISMQGLVRPLIEYNNIFLDNASGDVIGIAAGGSSGYHIENNLLQTKGGSQFDSTYGILVNSSLQPYRDAVIMNSVGGQSAASISYALQSGGRNYDNTTPIGLHYFCNDMEANDNDLAHDIMVADLTGDPYHGIAKLQGEDKQVGPNIVGYGARNKFATRVTPSGNNNIDRTAPTSTFKYYYKNGATGEQPINYPTTTNPITVTGFSLGIDCEELIPVQSPPPPNYDEYISARATLETALAVDGVMEIDAETGYCEGRELLHEYCRITEAMLEKYLNPQHTYTMDIVLGDTVYYPDTVIYYPDSAILVLDGANALHTYKRWLAGLYAGMGNYSAAYHELEGIISNYTLEEEDEDAVNDFGTLLAVKETLEDNDDDWGEINSGVKSWLEDAAYNAYGMLRYPARYFLSAYEGIDLLPEPYHPVEEEEEKQSNKHEEPAIKQLQEQKATAIKVYPNPATATINIHMGSYKGAMLAEVYDMMGRKLLTAKLNEGKNSVNIANLTPGNYILKLYNDDIAITVKRITKQ